MNNSDLKALLIQQCRTLLEEKAALFKKEMEEAQSAANLEEKSSAGDKYETSRAMNQNNRDMHAKQLAEVLHALSILNSINQDSISEKVAAGSVVFTSQANYFIAVNSGKVEIGDQTFFVVSPLSPIAQQMLNKVTGDKFIFNNRETTITSLL